MTRGPGQKTQRWFTRLYDPDSGEYEWYINPSVRGQKEVWRESTRDNALFLSTAIQLKAEHFQETFDWISDKLRVVPANNRISSDYTQKICTDDDSKIKVLSFLQAADTRISDILIEESEFNESMIPSVLPESLREELTKDLRGKTIRKLMTGHKTANGVIYLELSEESDGTQVLFALAGPWLDTLKTGKTLIIDELSNSLHPLVVGTLVEAFHNLDTNTGNAQLLFTGHETYVMDPRKMHRDEIYFLEKNESDATRIIPLSDFKPRGNEMFERGYLHGRYGGIPQVTSIES